MGKQGHEELVGHVVEEAANGFQSLIDESRKRATKQLSARQAAIQELFKLFLTSLFKQIAEHVLNGTGGTGSYRPNQQPKTYFQVHTKSLEDYWNNFRFYNQQIHRTNSFSNI